MQRTLTSRRPSRIAMLTACLGLAMSGLANAQVSVTSPGTGTVKGRAPIVATATITGTPNGPNNSYLVGSTLTASYTITDPDNDTPDNAATAATIQWTSNGAPVGTPGSATYAIQASDAGKEITYLLIPHTDAAITDPSQGVMTLASNVGSDGNGGGGSGGDGGDGGVRPAAEDMLLSVEITGNAVVSDTLTAVPTCTAACTANITYQWQRETGNGTDAYVDIVGATSATYSPTRDDQRRRIQVVAQQPAP
jgi:hypothetical protein